MKLQLAIPYLLSAACLVPVPAGAQDSGVYISQVDQGSSLTNPRRANSQDTTARVLSNASVPAPIPPTGNVNGLNFDLTTQNGLANAVNAAGQSGLGAGSLTNNVAVINQYGTGNTGSLGQEGIGNVGRINQYGTGSRATTEVSGNYNNTLQTQLGLGGNTSAIGIVGSGNNVNSGQIGIGNSSAVTVSGSGYNISTQQIGVGLSYSFDSTTASNGLKTITVNQVGVGSGAGVATGTLPMGVAPIQQTGR